MKLNEMREQWGDEAPVSVVLQREVLDLEAVAHFTIDGEPQSKARARVTFKNGKASAYTPRQTQAAEETVAWMFRQAGGRGPDAESTFGVFAVFFCGTRQRRDVDNMLKLILDGLNKVAWKDDAQVTEVSGRLTRGVPASQARSEIVVYRTESAMSGGLVESVSCEQCAAPIRVYRSTRNRRFCSRECLADHRREFTPRECLECGKPTTRGGLHCSVACMRAGNSQSRLCPGCGAEFVAAKRSSQKFCSAECHAADSRGRQLVRPTKTKCADCGAPVSKSRYTRCRGCAIMHRRASA